MATDLVQSETSSGLEVPVRPLYLKTQRSPASYSPHNTTTVEPQLSELIGTCVNSLDNGKYEYETVM